MPENRIIVSNQLEKSIEPNSILISNSDNEARYKILTSAIKLPTPKVYLPTNGFYNQYTVQEPSTILSLDPTSCNKEINIKLYYEGNDSWQEWMDYPDLKYELMRLKPYQSKYKSPSQKQRTGHVWVHPSHDNGSVRSGTNYSGGIQSDNSGNTLSGRETEWKVSMTTNKGVAQIVGNNPFTDIKIDPKLWFYKSGNPTAIGSSNYILPMTYINYIDSNIKVSGGKGSNRYHNIQTFKICFRMSAADPNSWNSAKNRYDKRIYSEYSEAFEIYPHYGLFEYNVTTTGSGDYERIMYEWRIKGF